MDPILSIETLGFPWATDDPFLFCVHHLDRFPAGDGSLAPRTGLEGRELGQDFAGKDGWNMYHGRRVPGFPAHPHRGFETLTVVLQGRLDHADSLGAAARYGDGDAQWLTTGAGIVHSEMFPLLKTREPNPTELFQIWVNLPPSKKMAPPNYAMLWAEAIPNVALAPGAKARVIAGALAGRQAPPPPPDSWAADAANAMAVWVLDLQPGAGTALPAAEPGLNRSLYVFEGSVVAADRPVEPGRRLRLRSEMELPLKAGRQGARLLLLQGRPIAAPVAQYGPFVMNSRQQLMQAFEDYQRTQFGAWTWPDEAPTHGDDPARFARYPDGRQERP